MPNAQASIRLFEFRGITVSLHVSWFLVAIYELGNRSNNYSSIAWNVLEYLALFAIVLMHEFGHALACRSVGGEARDILLWPFGGIAYVDPPPRPGATLWSIAAGPLVNVALIPVLLIVMSLAAAAGIAPNGDFHAWLRALTLINVGLLLFNVMPVYPLDGGQILAALLWFVVGRARGLKITALFGFVGIAAVIGLAIVGQSVWLGLMALFLGSQCLNGLRRARAIQMLDDTPRRSGFACPSCGAAPPAADLWRCANCDTPGDPFAIIAAAFDREAGVACPMCGVEFDRVRCIACTAAAPLGDWRAAAPVGIPAALPPMREMRVPSIAPVVMAVVLAIVALVALLVSAGSLVTAVARARLWSRGQTEQQRLWSSDGIHGRGERSVDLDSAHVYVALLDVAVRTRHSSPVEIAIRKVPTGEPVPVAILVPGERSSGPQRNGREMLSVAFFEVPARGQYAIRASSIPPDASLKIGLAEASITESFVWRPRALSAASFLIALALAGGAVLMVRRYHRQKTRFVEALGLAAQPQA